MIYTICAVIAIVSYLLGSLNFGIIFSKRFKHKDVRENGSGNAGATNMLRSYGKVWGALTIVFDMLKVGVAIILAIFLIKKTGYYESVAKIFPENTDIIIKSFVGFFCVLGHIFPCFFGFKGGKGVATSGGMVFMIDWHIALVLLMFFIIVVFVTKYVSLGSLVMAFFYPVLIFGFYHSLPLTIIAIVFALIVFVAHRENIKKLINHTENKIVLKKETDENEEE